MPDSKPNILFLMADDHRYNAIHSLGNPEVITPTFDTLVRQGTTLTHTYIMGSTSPAVCMPSRAMLLTGRSLFRSGEVAPENPYRIPEHVSMFPELLRQAGYITHGIGKWHNPRRNFARSFGSGEAIFFGGMSDHDKVPVHAYDPTGEYPQNDFHLGDKFSTELFGDAAVDFIKQHHGDQPFCLYVAFTAPHDPRTPPPEYAALYDPDQLTLPPNFMPQHPHDNGELRIRDELLAPFPRTPEIIRQHIADYYGMITHLDAKIGQILRTLDESGQAKNTIVIYAADHGLAVGQHGLMGKQNMFDHSLRVPLIIRGPGIPADQQLDSLCYLYDMFPTICEWADIPIPCTCEGHSLLSLISGNKQTHRDSIFAAYQAQQIVARDGRYQRMIRSGEYKLIEYHVDGKRTTLLFDLSRDPHEIQNLADDAAYSEVVRRLRQELRHWQQEVGDRVEGQHDH